MSIPDALQQFPFEGAKWGPKVKPVLILDGKAMPIREVVSEVRGEAAYVVGVIQSTFEQLCAHLRVPTVQFYEMRVSDLSPH